MLPRGCAAKFATAGPSPNAPPSARRGYQPRIRTGILRLYPDLDIVTAAQVGILGLPDPDVLAWAASENRIVVSNDRRTMGVAAATRIVAGEVMPGLLLIRRNASLGEVIRGLEEILVCTEPGELENRIEYIPIE